MSPPSTEDQTPDIDIIRTDPDPIRRSRRATELIDTYQKRMSELAEIRKQAIEEAHDGGMSYTEIAESLGLTKGRITQIRTQQDPAASVTTFSTVSRAG